MSVSPPDPVVVVSVVVVVVVVVSIYCTVYALPPATAPYVGTEKIVGRGRRKSVTVWGVQKSP